MLFTASHPFEIEIPKDIVSHPMVTVQENDWMRQVRSMRNADYSVELDWSYLNIIYDNDGRETFPRLLLAVEPKNGFILVNELLSPSHNQPGIIFNVLDHFVERYGKPTEIIICDDDLYGILADACNKVKIKLTKKKKLLAVQKARKEILSG